MYIEEARVGAKLQFGDVWLKSNEEFTTEMKFGMDDLMFSNFDGEIADRYYRQIDFEAYEIGRGKICDAGSWTTGKQRVEAEATKKDRKRYIF